MSEQRIDRLDTNVNDRIDVRLATQTVNDRIDRLDTQVNGRIDRLDATSHFDDD